MSLAYRKWKEDIKAYRKGEFRKCEPDYIILLADTSMVAYRKIRRVRQRELKRMKKIQGIIARIETMQLPDFEWKLYGNLQQVSEAGRIRQANEYWRQDDAVH